MGNGYWIIVGSGFLAGLNLERGQLYSEGERNWWPHDDITPPDEIELLKKHPGLRDWAFFKAVLN